MNPLKLAIVGCGKRTRTVYGLFLKQIASEIVVVAVCDPVKAAADEAASFYNAKPFYSIRDLVSARPMDAVLLVTPGDSHHALSLFLSRNRIHHACETPIASTLAQAREMVHEAEKARIILHVNEQFFRRDVIAFSRQIISSGAIGTVGRALIHGGHSGTHDISILLSYAEGQKPVAVNALAHAMPVERHKELYNRWFEEEHYTMRAIHFDKGFLGVNTAANHKGALGRQSRPGHLEVHGSRGAFIETGLRPEWPWMSRAEVRITSPEAMADFSFAAAFPLACETGADIPYHGDVRGLQVELPGGPMVYRNPTLDFNITNTYLSSVALATLDFGRAVREKTLQQYTARDALTAMEIEEAFRMSAQKNGARMDLPLGGTADATPSHEIDSMIDIAFPKTYSG